MALMRCCVIVHWICSSQGKCFCFRLLNEVRWVTGTCIEIRVGDNASRLTKYSDKYWECAVKYGINIIQQTDHLLKVDIQNAPQGEFM